MVVFPPAKINLGLNILDKRPDGFHNLETVFYPIDLYDVLEVIVCPDADIDFEFTQTGVPLDCAPEKNLCYKAFQRIKSSFPEIEPIKVHLHKTIPTGAGMGGGSSDGAFMLQLLKSIFNLTISDAVLKNMALELGSDCPFFLVNRPSLALGRGEIISHCPIQLKGFHILTQLAEIPINEWNKWVKNDFEKPVFHHYPEIASIKESLYEQGAVFASMSGSGSTVFGIFKDKPQALPHFPESYFCKWV
jgi:4-diphosphocytidyl-2-C-methyl-D-erythritol kinase